MSSPSTTIAKPANFSFQECSWFLDRGYDDCMHAVDSGIIIKALNIDGQVVALKVEEETAALKVTIHQADSALLEQSTRFVRSWLDLDRDLSHFYQLDHVLASELQSRYYGLRLIGIPDLFEALCWSVIGQQINLTFAYQLKRRFVEKYGSYIDAEDRRLYLFPSVEAIAALEIAELKALQFSKQKADYIITLARQMESGELTHADVSNYGNTAAMSNRLQQLRGVGEWTANYVLMKTFGRMDSVPYSDAGLINGIQRLQRLPFKPSRSEVMGVFVGAAGWEAYLVFYIWRSLSQPPPEISIR